MKKLIALCALLICSQSSHAMNALKEKQKDVAREYFLNTSFQNANVESEKDKWRAAYGFTVISLVTYFTDELKAPAADAADIQKTFEAAKARALTYATATSPAAEVDALERLDLTKPDTITNAKKLLKLPPSQAAQERKKLEEEQEKLKLQRQKLQQQLQVPQGPPQSSSTSDESIIQGALETVKELPQILADLQEKIDSSKTPPAQKKAALEEQEDVLNKLGSIEGNYFKLYDRNKDHKSVKEITAILQAGVKAERSDEMNEVITSMMSLGNLQKTVQKIDTIIKVGNDVLKEPNIKPEQKEAINKQLGLLAKEKNIIEELIKTDDPNVTFAHAKELWKELTALQQELQNAKATNNENDIKRITKEIDQLYQRAPHLLTAYEVARDSQMKKFLPKNIKAYVLAKRDEILAEKAKSMK